MIDIYLQDGSILENLEVNGNCLVSKENIDDSKLTDEMLSKIIINEQEFKNITLVRKWVDNDGKIWIALRQKTDDEVWKEKYGSNIDYIAMMTDVDIEV